MFIQSPMEAIPWVGLYIALASLICTLAMAADVIQGIRKRKLWFPNRFFTLNAASLTLIAIAMKLPVDLTTDSSRFEVGVTKNISFYFLLIMLANFLPSLGLMDNIELLINILALGILVITTVVNLWIQGCAALPLSGSPLVFPILWPFSVALIVSATRKKLDHRYKESQRMVTSHEKMFSSKQLRRYVKRYWMMVETHNPQFVIACLPISSTCGVVCLMLAFLSGLLFVGTIIDERFIEFGISDYKWSTKIIFMVQSIGIVVGSVAPIFRCLTFTSHFTLSWKWSKNQLNVFHIEKHWIQTLKQWKHMHIPSHIPFRHFKIVLHNIKNTFLNFFIALHIIFLVMCRIYHLVVSTFLILLSYCWHFFKSFLKKYFEKVENVSNGTMSSEIEEYTMYVVQIEDDVKLSKRIIRNTLRSITQILDASEHEDQHNLMMLLAKSKGFHGVVEFDNDNVPPLYPEETLYCWSLVVVTLTTIVITLPKSGNFKGLLSSMRVGLQYVKHIEECLDADSDLVKARKAARRVWAEVEVYHTWLQIDLQKKARKGKTSIDILKWLGDEAAKIVILFKSSKRSSIDHSPYKFVLACSMYRISNTILCHYNEQENLLNDEELTEWISTIIADVLLACFTNLPRVIKIKCNEPKMEKRGESIRNAARLLGQSKSILKILKARQLPNIDLDSMAYIDRWRVLPKSQIPSGAQIPHGGQIPNNGRLPNNGASLDVTRGTSDSNESLNVTIM